MAEASRKTALKLIRAYFRSIAQLGGSWEHEAGLELIVDTDADRDSALTVGASAEATGTILTGAELAGGFTRELEVRSGSDVRFWIKSRSVPGQP